MGQGPLFHERILDVEGRALYARKGGPAGDDGPPVVMVHGFIVAGTYLMPVARRLAERFTVWVPDLPGYGRSEASGPEVDVDGLAASLLAFCDAALLGEVDLLANSTGCQVAVAAAASAPLRVRRLVLTSPTIDPAGRSALEQTWRWVKNARHDDARLAPIIVRDYLAAGFRRAVATARATLRDRIEARLPFVQCPCLVVRGELDPIAPRAFAEEMVRLLPDGDLVELEGAPHTVNFTTPDALYDAVAPFLEAGRPSSTSRRSRAHAL